MKVFLNPFLAFFVFTGFIFITYSKPDIVIVGESHTSTADHKKQLEVIEEFYNRYPDRLIIAMEMFQQPFQEYLDLYIDGKITEEELLEKTEYKKRWGYDFSYYRDILQFAREKKIKVVALNVPAEFLKEVREKGVENLRSSYLPAERIEYNQQEVEFIKNVMKEHGVQNSKKFMDVQYSWDAGMSYKIYKTKQEYPQHTVIVLIGKGHAETVARFLRVMSPGLKVVVY